VTGQLSLDAGHELPRADFSPCRRYRYALRRTWGDGKPVVFVGLNPSTADETQDDPTIRRCIRFARDWGYPGLVMANLYAWRSTDPGQLRKVEDPIGPDADVWLARLAAEAGIVVCAWGTNADNYRAERAAAILQGDPPRALHVLGLSKHGAPLHPLYQPARLTPQPWTPE
jgi:hypothetical protein